MVFLKHLQVFETFSLVRFFLAFVVYGSRFGILIIYLPVLDQSSLSLNSQLEKVVQSISLGLI